MTPHDAHREGPADHDAATKGRSHPPVRDMTAPSPHTTRGQDTSAGRLPADTDAAEPASGGAIDELRATFRGFARHRAGRYAPFTAALATAIANDAELLTAADAAPAGQNRPDLLLAVIHELATDLHDASTSTDAKRGSPGAAAAAYRRAARHTSRNSGGDELAASWAVEPGDIDEMIAFARRHREEITRRITGRTAQLNEIGRAAYLYPALVAASITTGTEAPLGLVEVGASAGLLLLLDHYRITYWRDTTAATCPHGRLPVLSESTLIADPDAAPGPGVPAPALHCQLHGPHDPPLKPRPTIGVRFGLDLAPLDVANPAHRRWLHALIWPEHSERAGRLDAALRLAQTLDQHPNTRRQLWAADAADVGTLLDRVPGDQHPVVFHSAVLAHMTAAARDRFATAVLAASRRRPLSWIQAEPRDDGDPRRLRVLHCDGGTVRGEVVLGSYHPHGHNLTWSADTNPLTSFW